MVETGHWFAGKEIVILPKQIVHISYDESKLFVGVTKESILKAPQYNVRRGRLKIRRLAQSDKLRVSVKLSVNGY